MKTAFIFPGQASQYVGMGKDLYDANERVREYFDRAGEVLSFDLKKVCFEGPEEELKQTKITQPAIFVHSVAVASLLSPGDEELVAVAGHSLGEYSAIVAAGAVSFEQALEVVALRGELMQNAGDERPGTMAAVIGLDAHQIRKVCDEASEGGEVVVPANLNAPGQIVISGDVPAVERAMELAKEAGAKRAVKLNVSGAFHSPLMAPAAQTLGEKLAEIDMRPPAVPVYQNVTAHPATDPGDLRKLLIEQLTEPVLWADSVRAMADNGVERFLEVGPGNVLQGLVKRTAKGATIEGVGTVEQLEALKG